MRGSTSTSRHGSSWNRPRSIGSRPGTAAPHRAPPGTSSARSETTSVAPASRSASPAPAVDPDHEAEPAGGAGAYAGDGVLQHHRVVRGHVRARTRRAGRCRAPACPGRPAASATLPSTTVANRSAMPAAASTAGALADEETTASGRPRSRRWSSSASDPGYGATPSRVEHLVERVVLAVAQPPHGDLVRARPRWCPRAGRCRGRRGSRGRRRSGASRRRGRSSRRRCRARCRRRRRSRARKPLNISDQARMWTSAVGVSTPSRSKSTARWSAQSTAGGSSVMPRG